MCLRKYLFKREPGTSLKAYLTLGNDGKIDSFKRYVMPKTKGFIAHIIFELLLQ